MRQDALTTAGGGDAEGGDAADDVSECECNFFTLTDTYTYTDTHTNI